jgi:hypothetical protein
MAPFVKRRVKVTVGGEEDEVSLIAYPDQLEQLLAVLNEVDLNDRLCELPEWLCDLGLAIEDRLEAPFA